MDSQGHNNPMMMMMGGQPQYEPGPAVIPGTVQPELQGFWARQYEEAERTTDFKNHSLPLARIKKIMKADEDVRMISAEAPVVFARACEMFVLELTLRSWAHTEENKRRTLQKNDIAAAITRTDIFDFLVDIVPREDLANEAASMGPADSLPYCYMAPPPPPPQHPMMDSSAGMYMAQPQPQMMPPPYMAHQPPMWPPDHHNNNHQSPGDRG